MPRPVVPMALLPLARSRNELAGLDAIDEAIGRATEMGRPVIFANGSNGLDDAQTIASFPVLSYAAHACARYDTKLIAVSYVAAVFPVMEAIVRASYIEANKQTSYDPVSTVRFIASGWGAAASALQGTMRRERVAACLYMGAFFAETTMICEVGASLGAIQVAGTAQTAQLPFMISSCDYTLIDQSFGWREGGMGRILQPAWPRTGGAFGRPCGCMVKAGGVRCTVGPGGSLCPDGGR